MSTCLKIFRWTHSTCVQHVILSFPVAVSTWYCDHKNSAKNKNQKSSPSSPHLLHTHTHTHTHTQTRTHARTRARARTHTHKHTHTHTHTHTHIHTHTHTHTHTRICSLRHIISVWKTNSKIGRRRKTLQMKKERGKGRGGREGWVGWVGVDGRW